MIQRHFWDFFGPDAPQTARHFHHHLLEFLEHHQLQHLKTGTGRLEEGHAHCWCEVDDTEDEPIRQRLRPRRSHADGTWPEELPDP